MDVRGRNWRTYTILHLADRTRIYIVYTYVRFVLLLGSSEQCSMDGYRDAVGCLRQGVKFKRRNIGCHIGGRMGYSDTNKKITNSVSTPRDEFIKPN